MSSLLFFVLADLDYTTHKLVHAPCEALKLSRFMRSFSLRSSSKSCLKSGNVADRPVMHPMTDLPIHTLKIYSSFPAVRFV